MNNHNSGYRSNSRPQYRDSRKLFRKATDAAERPFLADPFGEFVVVGEQMFNPSLDAGEKFPVPVALVSAVRPVVYGMKEDKLVVMSVNSRKVVASGDVPELPSRVRPPGRLPVDAPLDRAHPFAFWHRTHVLEDVANKTVLVCSPAGVFGFPVEGLEIPDEPVLRLRLAGAADFAVGRKSAVGLIRSDPAAQVTLAAGPEGMTVEGNALVWTPGVTAVGTHRVRLTITKDKAEKTITATARAARPAIPPANRGSGPRSSSTT